MGVFFSSRPQWPLATVPERMSIGESLSFQGTGLLVVFIALALIWGMIEVIGLFFKGVTRRAAAAKVASVRLDSVAAAGDDARIAPHLLAVISAALHVALGEAHRIREIKPAEPATDWAREGRRQIFQSHNPR